MPDQPSYPPPPPFMPPPGSGGGSASLPPVVYPPSMFIPPRQGGGFARAIFTTLAVSIFGLSLSLNLYLLIASGIFGSRADVDQTTITGGDSKNIIAVVAIQGEITAATATQFEAEIKAVAADTSVRAVLLRIDSQGGSVTASDQIYDDVLRLKKEHGLPVVVAMGGLATSGGYYIACAADKIVAQRTTWTGNIGVLLPRINLAELAKKYGVEDATLKSTGADFKDAGSMFKHDTPEQTAYWQNLADEAFAVFKQVVRDGRNLDSATVDRIANGKVYSGAEAAKLRLVDVVGYDQDAIDLAKSLAGMKGAEMKVVQFERSRSIFESLGSATGSSSGRSSGNSSSAAARQAGGIETQFGPATVRLDPAAVREWLTPRPMYLWSGQ